MPRPSITSPERNSVGTPGLGSNRGASARGGPLGVALAARSSVTTALSAKLAFLRASGAFDGVLEVRETHMSWVFLTARHAFKLKKPVHLPYVDYRTIARRRRSCENELR